MKTKKQFILDTLLPYKNDRTLCGYEDGGCRYLTSKLKKCALGKHLKTGKWQKAPGGANYLFNLYDKKEVLTDEAYKQDFSTYQWMQIQAYHDRLAYNSISNANSAVTKLEASLEINLDELRF